MLRGYLSRDSRKSKKDILLKPGKLASALKPGKSKRHTMIVRVPQGTATGLWFLIACADASHVVRETNDGNNCRASARRTAVSAKEPSQPAPPPPAIAGQGYTVTFQDQFDSLNLAVWTPHSFWETEVPGSVSVSNGLLSIANKRSDGYPEAISVQSGPEWNGSPSRYDFMFGYAEARMRFTGGKGSWPAFWLSSVAHAQHVATLSRA